MKLVASINCTSSFNKIFDYVDGVVVCLSDYNTSTINFSINDVLSMIDKCDKVNKEFILDICGIYNNTELNSLKEILINLVKYNISIIYSDIAIYMLLKELGCENIGIYDPKTHITNSCDMLEYMSLNIKGCAISSEILFSDVMKLNSVKQKAIWYKAFGYHQMFHSKRQLISTYAMYKEKEIDITNNMYLKEETRDVKYHITQNNLGTVIYRDYIICLIKEVESLRKLDYVFLDSQFINDDLFEMVTKLFCKALNNLMSIEDACDFINRLDLNIEDGFAYKDTIYLKEHFKK